MRKLRLTPHLIVCMMGFSNAVSLSVVAPILSIFVKEVINAPIEIVGLVSSIFFIASSISRFSTGLFGGGKRTIDFLLAAFVVLSICPALYSLTGNISILVVVRAVHGFTFSFIGTALLVLASISISSVDRDKGVGSYTASLSLGLLAGPTITIFSIPLFGVSNIFYFASLTGVIGIFAAFFLTRKVSSIEKDWQIIGITADRERLRNKILGVMRNRMFVISLVGTCAFFMSYGVMQAYAPLHAKEALNFSNELVSMLFLSYYAATTATRLFVGKIVSYQRVDKSVLVILSTGSTALFALSLVFSKSDLAFAGFFISIGGIQGILFPVGSMLIADHIQPSRNVIANSLYTMGTNFGQGLAPLIAAGAIVRYGMEYGFVMSAAICTIATLFLIWLYRCN